MTKNDYDQLFRQLCNLKTEAPCHNGPCVGHQQCEYGINGCYGDECAIETVVDEANRRYNTLATENTTSESVSTTEEQLDYNGCPVCNSDYNQEIISTLIRYHISSEATSGIIETRFCPNCGKYLGN